MRRYSGDSKGASRLSRKGGGNQNVGWILCGLAVVGALALGGDGGWQSLMDANLQNRLADIQSGIESDRDFKRLEESAAKARALNEDFTCITVVNTDENKLGLEAGTVHVALIPGTEVIEPALGTALPPGTCVRDHLGGFSLLNDQGRVGRVYSDPNLALGDANEFTQDTTKTVIEGE